MKLEYENKLPISDINKAFDNLKTNETNETNEIPVLIIINSYKDNHFPGVTYLKRMRYLYPWGVKSDKEDVFKHYPIIFFSISENWRYGQVVKFNTEQQISRVFLPTMKNVYTVKLPYEIDNLKQIFENINNKECFEMKFSRLESESAYLAYDEHGGDHE